MTTLATDTPARVTAIQDHTAADHTARRRDGKPSRISLLLEALAYAGAAIDPASALAAQRFARIREQEQRDGRW
jgi:hypothetical protein